MHTTKVWSLDLRALILIFALLSALATLANTLATAYRVQREALIDTTLQSNRAYAEKVASSIGEFLRSAHSRLQYSAALLGRDMENTEVILAEIDRLQAQDDDFNSIVVMNAKGQVLQAYPESLQLVGATIRSEGVQQALAEHRPLVSPAYVSSKGNLVVFVSHPITAPNGEFVGIVGGSVYLRKDSPLHNVISGQFHHSGTFTFVADGNRRVLYHPEDNRIGQVLDGSQTVSAALRGETGAMAVRNYIGVPMLAGYAQVAGANWAVVAQQPRDISLEPQSAYLRDILVGMLPAGLCGLLLIWGGAVMITRPLQQLSTAASQLAAPQTENRLQNIHAWYRDAAAIREALLTSVQILQQKLGRLTLEAQSDPLTGLANRRAMGLTLDQLEKSGDKYAVLMLDVDNFKQVNDTHGHDVGDMALKQVASILRNHTRAGDLACRSGGEEFALILPSTSAATAHTIAERIRAGVAQRDIPPVGKLTVSIGVANPGPDMMPAKTVLKQADERLYQAKQLGRDRVVA